MSGQWVAIKGFKDSQRQFCFLHWQHTHKGLLVDWSLTQTWLFFSGSFHPQECMWGHLENLPSSCILSFQFPLKTVIAIRYRKSCLSWEVRQIRRKENEALSPMNCWLVSIVFIKECISRITKSFSALIVFFSSTKRQDQAMNYTIKTSLPALQVSTWDSFCMTRYHSPWLNLVKSNEGETEEDSLSRNLHFLVCNV